MKKTVLIIIIISLFLLCGCTGYREINRGYLATAIGFAQKDGKFNVIIETISSFDILDAPSERLLLSGEGNTLEDAVGNIKSQLVKHVYFEQLGTVVLQENFNEAQQEQIIDFLKNTYNVSYGVYLVKTADVTALFETQTHNGVLGYDIIGLIKSFQTQGDTKTQNQIYQYERQKGTKLPVVAVAGKKLIFEASGEK